MDYRHHSHQPNQRCVSSFGKALKMPDICLSGKSFTALNTVENTSLTEVQETDNRSVLGRRERLAKQTGAVADKDFQSNKTGKKGYISEWVYHFGFETCTLQQ